MTLMEKFANLTPKQRENLAEIKNAAALDAFASEHGLELTDEEKTQALEYIKTGVLPLSDDELESAAGGGGLLEGITTKAFTEAESQARADGRNHNLPVATMRTCACNHRYKWAEGGEISVAITYYNVKCYKCGKTWAKIYDYM